MSLIKQLRHDLLVYGTAALYAGTETQPARRIEPQRLVASTSTSTSASTTWRTRSASALWKALGPRRLAVVIR